MTMGESLLPCASVSPSLNMGAVSSVLFGLLETRYGECEGHDVGASNIEADVYSLQLQPGSVARPFPTPIPGVTPP